MECYKKSVDGKSNENANRIDSLGKKIRVTKLLRLIIISKEFNIFFFFTAIHCAGSFENFYKIAIL